MSSCAPVSQIGAGRLQQPASADHRLGGGKDTNGGDSQEGEPHQGESAGTGEGTVAAKLWMSFFPLEFSLTLFAKMEADYRASKDTPERLTEHRARMSFFNGSRAAPDFNPYFNPLYNHWESWTLRVQFIHSHDLPLGFAN